MAIHKLKTDYEVFCAMDRGDKNFEIRLNDRDFKVGDTLHLEETQFSGQQMKQGKPLLYAGRMHGICGF